MIFVSEIGDKTFFVAAVMATRAHPLLVLLVAFGALVLMTLISTLIGASAAEALPPDVIKWASVSLFLLCGLKYFWDAYNLPTTPAQVAALRADVEHDAKLHLVKPALDEETEGLLEAEARAVTSRVVPAINTPAYGEASPGIPEREPAYGVGSGLATSEDASSGLESNQSEQHDNDIASEETDLSGESLPGSNGLQRRGKPSVDLQGGAVVSVGPGQLVSSSIDKQEGTYTAAEKKYHHDDIWRDECGANRLCKNPNLRALWLTFLLTFASEWGDRSQIATISLAATANIYGVLIGSLAGHFLCTAMAVAGGSVVARYIPQRAVLVLGGLIFVAFAIVDATVGMDYF